MMNLLEKGAAFLAKKRAGFFSVPIEYRRGEDVLLQLAACMGSTLFRAEDNCGVTTRTRSVDFIMESPEFLPERGDEIRCNGQRFEVLAPNGEPVWRYSDNTGRSIRIHTKFIEEIADGDTIDA